MRSTLAVGIGALALASGLGIGGAGGIAQASSPPAQLSGSLTCKTTVKYAFGSHLTYGGTAPATVTVVAKLSSCSGAGATAGGLTLSKGTLKASSAPATTAANCGPVLAGSALPAMTGAVKWKASGGKVVSSAVSIPNASISYDVNGNLFNGFLPFTVTGGSFASETGTGSGLVSSPTAYMVSTSCSKGGLGAIAVGKTSGQITGSVTIEGAGS